MFPSPRMSTVSTIDPACTPAHGNRHVFFKTATTKEDDAGLWEANELGRQGQDNVNADLTSGRPDAHQVESDCSIQN